MESDSYWNQKKKHNNIFNDGPAAFGESPPSIAMSARPRPGQPKPPQVLAAAQPGRSPTPARSFTQPDHSTASASFEPALTSPRQLECLECKKVFLPDVTSIYEGRAAYDSERCRSAFLSAVAAQLTRGDSFLMHRIKSLTSKVQLVHVAITTGVASAIIRATIFLGQTTSDQVFREELRKLDVARNHYLSYLRQLGRYEDVAAIHDFMGEYRKAMMVRLSSVIESERSWTEVSLINGGPHEKFFDLVEKMVRQKIRLDALQMDLAPECQEKAKLADQDGAPVASWMLRVPVPPTLRETPLISTLLYVILFDHKSSGARLQKLEKDYDVKDPHMRWLRVQAMNFCGDYDLLKDAVTASKGITASTLFRTLTRKPTCFIPPQRVARYLRDNGSWDASGKCLCECLRLISDPNERYEWALELGALKEAVNCVIESKSEARMQTLARKLRGMQNQTELVGICDSYARTPVKLWKPL